MNASLYIGATGMKSLSDGIQVTTNNVANVSTIGYKQQNILFCDILYQTQGSLGESWNSQENSKVAIGQTGMGVQVETIRTNFQQGAFESSNTVTDLAINGKGFFQVTDGVNLYYTRAGDFRADSEGVWRTPSGYALNGYRINGDGSLGELAPVQVDTFTTIPARGTSNVTITVNLNADGDKCSSAENPYFSLLDNYNAAASPPLSQNSYGYAQELTLYDAQGDTHSVMAYFDGAPSDSPNSYIEFIIADTSASGQGADGVLMSGVLQFDSAGNLTGMSAFTPAVAGSQDLNDWQPATLVNGLPQLSMDGADMTVNFGVSASGGWENTPDSAAQVGTDAHSLPVMGDAVVAENASTAYNSSSPTGSYSQDGYSEGVLGNIYITQDGMVVGRFSNGQDQNLWQIPVCRFTSEDGLYREGGNLFSATDASGQMDMGIPGTENYGTVEAYNLENSNVDLATEMVNLIITQRGFQSNSKVVTTADQMLQKAMELKRS